MYKKYTVTEVVTGSIQREVYAKSEEDAIRIAEALPDNEPEIIGELEREEISAELSEENE